MPRHLEGHDRADDLGYHGAKDGPGPGKADSADPADDAGERPPIGAVSVLRVQTGVRMEKRLVKVLKALAELYDRSLGDLLEGIVLHAFEGRSPFSAESLRRIAELERIYGLDLEARTGHRAVETFELP
jgi:hypothetical protein